MIMPSRADISCTVVINGNENRAVHSGAYPKDAPLTEYVEMPDGSSSAAPVVSPGPSVDRKSCLCVEVSAFFRGIYLWLRPIGLAFAPLIKNPDAL